ncbi:MAG TPA: transglutaminase-like domain-containing protein [Acidimicrobiales bacterium]|nr:transglutaminase-like domain-containing protein [Acidimicrobiales bacterium]
MDDATGRFLSLVQADDVPVDEGAMLIAAHAHPGLDVAGEVKRLDELAADCPHDLDGLRSFLFGAGGFRGNDDAYGDPRNSYLNEVLDRRIGIPITLSVVAMEVGRRVGVPLVGIGLPGHFLVRHEAVPPLLLDPFNGGQSLSLEECHELVRRAYGESVPFQPSLLAPVDNRMILARMLNNLRSSFQASGDSAGSAWVLRLRAGIPGTLPRELGELATAQAALGRYEEAATTLERLADQLSGEEEGKARAHAQLLRSRLN